LAKRSVNPELINLAFHVWRKLGRNYEATVKELDRLGYAVSKPTLYAWSKKYGWQERADRADAEETELKLSRVSNREKVLRDLIKRKEAYDAYFASLEPGEQDHRALYAYTSLCRAIAEIEKSLSDSVAYASPIVMEAFVRFLQKREMKQEIRQALYEEIDAFLREVCE
jgi:plasmid replication initiation protein